MAPGQLRHYRVIGRTTGLFGTTDSISVLVGRDLEERQAQVPAGGQWRPGRPASRAPWIDARSGRIQPAVPALEKQDHRPATYWFRIIRQRRRDQRQPCRRTVSGRGRPPRQGPARALGEAGGRVGHHATRTSSGDRRNNFARTGHSRRGRPRHGTLRRSRLHRRARERRGIDPGNRVVLPRRQRRWDPANPVGRALRQPVSRPHGHRPARQSPSRPHHRNPARQLARERCPDQPERPPPPLTHLPSRFAPLSPGGLQFPRESRFPKHQHPGPCS